MGFGPGLDRTWGRNLVKANIELSSRPFCQMFTLKIKVTKRKKLKKISKKPKLSKMR